MFARRDRFKRRGQSLPLLALIIAVLFGMVGLAVDVGNTYAEQRNADRVTTAAALAGMDMYAANGTDANVASVIQASYESNNLPVLTGTTPVVVPGQNWMRAFYLDDFGNPICQVGRCGNRPAGVKYIQVRLSGTVETYFARVVGRPTLNVEAQAYAGQCTPTDGIYPLAIQAKDVGSREFNRPDVADELSYYKDYADENYPDPRKQRRIYLRDDRPGSFSFLRWKAYDNTSGNQQELEAMFRGDGNLDEGYSEWLDNNKQPTWPSTATPKPNGYPQLPRQFNGGDWVAGNPGINGQSAGSIFQQHINARTEMLFPIVDESAGGGNNTAYHVNRLGVFLMRGYGNQPSKGWYFDLVYLKQVTPQSCMFESLPNNPIPPRIFGPVSVRPMWKDVQKNERPVAYQMVMDTSGSMSFNFAGEGWLNGSGVQCELATNNYDPSFYRFPISGECQGGPKGSWNVPEERRVHITKTAIASFIDQMDEQDTMQIIKFTTSGSGPVDVNGDGKGNSSDWTRDKAALKAALLKAGQYNNNPYLTEGGTPGPQAIQSAATMLASNPPKTSPDGRQYRPVTIYMTDGVANVFVNGTGNGAEDICADIYRSFSNWNTANTVTKNTPRCQLGFSERYNQERPISSMITLANSMKRSNPDLALYVVSLASVNATGLDQVATNPSMHYPATSPQLVKAMLSEINAVVENAKCISRVDPDVQVIDSGHTPVTAYPAGTFGYVEIFDQSGKPLPGGKGKLPIKHDPVTGLLGFRQEANQSIAPGIYQLIAYISYKADDGVTRQYDKMYDRATGGTISVMQFEILPDNGLGGEIAIDPIVLQFKEPTLCK